MNRKENEQREADEDQATVDLTTEDHRLIERIYLDFTRSGAAFDADKQKENADIVAKIACDSYRW